MWSCEVLIHYGGKSTVKSGLIDKVESSLVSEGVEFVELGGVVPSPELSKVREGIELSLKTGVGFILAVSGGSVIDSTKAIACGLAVPEGDVWELFEKKRTTEVCAPIGVILTIAAMGAR